MEIVYYYVLYLKRMSKKTPGRYKIDIHILILSLRKREQKHIRKNAMRITAISCISLASRK